MSNQVKSGQVRSRWGRTRSSQVKPSLVGSNQQLNKSPRQGKATRHTYNMHIHAGELRTWFVYCDELGRTTTITTTNIRPVKLWNSNNAYIQHEYTVCMVNFEFDRTYYWRIKVSLLIFGVCVFQNNRQCCDQIMHWSSRRCDIDMQRLGIVVQKRDFVASRFPRDPGSSTCI